MSAVPRRAQRFAAQDRVFAVLERLESKSTQAAAYEELQHLIKDLETSALSTLLQAAGTTTANTTAWSRVHALRVAALCCQPERCTAWRDMLAPPLLLKLLGLLTSGLRDADSAVRAAAANGFGVVAAQLLAAYPGGCELTAGTPANPLLACLLDALGELGAAVQAAAATALGLAGNYLSPGLDPALLHQLLRALSNPLCLGRPELCRALARLEDGRVLGLLASSCQQLLAAAPEVLGSTAEGTGLLGALACRGKDFQLRAAAVHSLKALAVGLGPMLPGGWEAVAAALTAAKTDVSKPVRDAAQGALPVVAGLLEFLAAGAPAEAWPEACGLLLAATEGGRRYSPGAGHKSKGTGTSAAALGGLPGPSTKQHVPAAWSCSAAVPAPPALPECNTAEPAAGAAMPVAMQPAALLAYPQATLAAGARGPPAAAAMSHAAEPAGLPCASPAGNSPEQLAAQLSAIQAQQALLAATLSAFTSATHCTLRQMQQHLASVSAGVAALASGAAGGTCTEQSAALQQHLDSVSAAMATLAVGAGNMQHITENLATAGRSQAALASLPAPTAGGHSQQQQRASAAQAAPGRQAKRLSSLHRSFDALEQQRLEQAPAQLRRRQHQEQQDAAGQCSATTAEAPLPLNTSPTSKTAAAPCPPASCEAVYSRLLTDLAGGDHQAVRLLRCMAKTGPVWELLSPSMGQQLMARMAGMLEEGIALKCVLPWLKPLSDSASPAAATAAAVPPDLRQRVLAALAAYPLPSSSGPDVDSVQAECASAEKSAAVAARAGSLMEKRERLLLALRAVWDC
ncbi:hypothetical protein ABPG77_010649 [Micractinium sp. CCAP 211/92]